MGKRAETAWRAPDGILNQHQVILVSEAGISDKLTVAYVRSKQGLCKDVQSLLSLSSLIMFVTISTSTLLILNMHQCKYLKPVTKPKRPFFLDLQFNTLQCPSAQKRVKDGQSMSVCIPKTSRCRDLFSDFSGSWPTLAHLGPPTSAWTRQCRPSTRPLLDPTLPGTLWTICSGPGPSLKFMAA